MAGDFEYYIRRDDWSWDAEAHGYAESLERCREIFNGMKDCHEMSVFNEKSNKMWFDSKPYF